MFGNKIVQAQVIALHTQRPNHVHHALNGMLTGNLIYLEPHHQPLLPIARADASFRYYNKLREDSGFPTLIEIDDLIIALTEQLSPCTKQIRETVHLFNIRIFTQQECSGRPDQYVHGRLIEVNAQRPDCRRSEDDIANRFTADDEDLHLYL